MPATFSEIFWAWTAEKQTKTSINIPKRLISELLLATDNTDLLLILPFRHAAWSPWCARGFELFLELVQIDFDQLSQLAQHAFEVLRRGVVLRDLSLSRARDRHALRADN